jgi:hypothetical protein
MSGFTYKLEHPDGTPVEPAVAATVSLYHRVRGRPSP